MDLLAAHRRALATRFSGTGRRRRTASAIRCRRSGPATAARARVNAAADQQLMTLLRRLTAISSQPGRPRRGEPARRRDRRPRRVSRLRRRPSGYASSRHAGPVSGADKGAISSRSGLGAESSRGAQIADPGYGDGLTGLMAVNLIRAHREELIQASTGKLDHMVIDVVGSLFDQILSDSRVPPQMAREIARLQLPVLRVALSDQTFFSTRRHPVRRFINRIASLANAFDDFDVGPGAQFLRPRPQARRRDRRGRLRPDRALRGQGRRARAVHRRADRGRGRAVRRRRSVLDQKESELRVQQRYMLQLQARARADAAAGVHAGVPRPGLEPGAGPRGAARRRGLRPCEALPPRSASIW